MGNSLVHNALETTKKKGKRRLKKRPIHLIRLISAHVTSSFLDGPRQRCKIGELLIQML
jgi:hypothetical protein